jgi:hypothetical protein
MVEAAMQMLENAGVTDDCIFYDKFTTTGSPDDD